MARKILRRLRSSSAVSAAPVPPSETDLPGEPLTGREVEVPGLPGTGATNREIAEKLSLTEGTVKNYISTILAKTGLHDRTQAALYAFRPGAAPSRAG